MHKIEPATSGANEVGRPLHDDELDAISGGSPRGGEPVKYMEVKLTEVMITSVQF